MMIKYVYTELVYVCWSVNFVNISKRKGLYSFDDDNSPLTLDMTHRSCQVRRNRSEMITTYKKQRVNKA